MNFGGGGGMFNLGMGGIFGLGGQGFMGFFGINIFMGERCKY